MVIIQEWFVIKNGLSWHVYGTQIEEKYKNS